MTTWSCNWSSVSPLTVEERNRLVALEQSDKPSPYRRDVDGHLIAMSLVDITPFDDEEAPSMVSINATGSDYVHEVLLAA